MRGDLEPVHLHQVAHTCRARWQLKGVGTPWIAYVSIGTLDADGCWYVDVVEHLTHTPEPVGGEEEARAVAAGWMAELAREHGRHGKLAGQEVRWVRVPCYATLGWRRGEQPPSA